jgi:hypothetical protein
MKASSPGAQTRDIVVEDIIVRKPVHFEEDQIRGLLEGKLFSYWRRRSARNSAAARSLASAPVGLEIAESRS